MRIAVCDDNPKELERIKGCFCRIQGYDLVCSYFDSTSTVMEILKTENSPYDLYILDIEMPGMNGLKHAKSIREKDITFLFRTSPIRHLKNAIKSLCNLAHLPFHMELKDPFLQNTEFVQSCAHRSSCLLHWLP